MSFSVGWVSAICSVIVILMSIGGYLISSAVKVSANAKDIKDMKVHSDRDHTILQELHNNVTEIKISIARIEERLSD